MRQTNITHTLFFYWLKHVNINSVQMYVHTVIYRSKVLATDGSCDCCDLYSVCAGSVGVFC